MKHRRALSAGILVNAALLAALLATGTGRDATAQAPANRPRGEYTLLSGKLGWGGPHAIYVLDSSNNEMIALRWEQSRQTLSGIGYRNLSTDTNAQVGR